ncbi:hypothetical protein B0J11DRAFT_593361 [Dendryphion nanum]|uniref:Uncharacterized protein n=1 Tax=Dendryphion nanum TaxID=256645 RepID=A0A9P9DBI1_9PLEO|nr:hypothetical protein B0J11DRAFT_593361 [Dendryphion nanum]
MLLPPPGITKSSSVFNGITLPPAVTKSSSVFNGIIPPPGITLPPNPSNPLPTGAGVRSSASDLSIGFVGVYTLIQNWIDNPSPPLIKDLTIQLDVVLPKAKDLLEKLPQSPGAVEPCKSGKIRRSRSEDATNHILDERGLIGDVFKTAFGLVKCVVDTTNRVKDAVIQGTSNAVDLVKGLQVDLKPMIDALNEVELIEDPNGGPGQPKPSGPGSGEPEPTQSDKSSSSSCTPQTVSNCNIGCTAIATTTMKGPSKRAEGNACTTVCGAPITRCGATGVTSTSTVTSTITEQRLCSPECSVCNSDKRAKRTLPPLSGLLSIASADVLDRPVSTLNRYSQTIKARQLIPKQTTSPDNNLQKRALSSPTDRGYDSFFDWLELQLGYVEEDGKQLQHGLGHGIFTTGFSFPLLDSLDSWSLIGLYGCTSVIVISRKRIFMTHIWEAPSMLEEESFQSHVLDTLLHGDVAGGVPEGLIAFTGTGGDFENTDENNVRAIIITPYRRGPPQNPNEDGLLYINQVNRIKDTLKDALGRQDTHIVPYHPRLPDPGEKTTYGKILIQYDPAHAVVTQPDTCVHQPVAAIELWFENQLAPRYRDEWLALPNQLAANLGPQNSLFGPKLFGGGRRNGLLTGPEVSSFEEEGQDAYKAHIQRQEGGACVISSRSVSGSSTSPLSSKTQGPTTLGTSFVSSGTITTLSDMPSSSTISSSMTTQEPLSSTKEPPPQSSTLAPPVPPAPSRAVSVVLQSIRENDISYNTWSIFETSIGHQVDGCGNGVNISNEKEQRWSDRPGTPPNQRAISKPEWPEGIFKIDVLFGERGCEYRNNGGGTGLLYCPSMGTNNGGCTEDNEKSQSSAAHQCLYSGTMSRSYRRVVHCMW